jgi:hypothetical protein
LPQIHCQSLKSQTLHKNNYKKRPKGNFIDNRALTSSAQSDFKKALDSLTNKSNLSNHLNIEIAIECLTCKNPNTNKIS